jgi:hypothetical protein
MFKHKVLYDETLAYELWSSSYAMIMSYEHVKIITHKLYASSHVKIITWKLYSSSIAQQYVKNKSIAI